MDSDPIARKNLRKGFALIQVGIYGGLSSLFVFLAAGLLISSVTNLTPDDVYADLVVAGVYILFSLCIVGGEIVCLYASPSVRGRFAIILTLVLQSLVLPLQFIADELFGNDLVFLCRIAKIISTMCFIASFAFFSVFIQRVAIAAEFPKVFFDVRRTLILGCIAVTLTYSPLAYSAYCEHFHAASFSPALLSVVAIGALLF